MYLTLPIPAEKKWSHTIYYVPLDPTQPHLKVSRNSYKRSLCDDSLALFCILNNNKKQIPIEINRDASFRDVRNLLGRWKDVEGDNVSSSILCIPIQPINFPSL